MHTIGTEVVSTLDESDSTASILGGPRIDWLVCRFQRDPRLLIEFLLIIHAGTCHLLLLLRALITPSILVSCAAGFITELSTVEVELT